MKNQIKSLSMLLFVAAIIITLFNACRKECHECKETTSEVVSITSNIKGVIIEGPWQVTLTQNDSNNSAEIVYCTCLQNKVSAHLLPNGYLHIRVTSWDWDSYRCNDFRATITAAALEIIEGSGAADIRTYGNFGPIEEITLSGASTLNGLVCEGATAKIRLSGASTLKGFKFNGNNIDTDLSGASKATIVDVNLDDCLVICSGASTFSCNGYAATTSFTGSGASDMKTLNLVSENLYIDLSGASSTQITVNETIKGRLTGASILKYKGDADVSGVHLSGESKIIKL
jgi:hypothetical protein